MALATASLTDRAVFWAELGLVASPTLLARVGQVLQTASIDDLELQEAMRLAARHVERSCLVWPGAFRRPSRESVETNASDAQAPASSSSDSASDLDDIEKQPHRMARLGLCCLHVLPGMGGFGGMIVWLFMLASGCALFFWLALFQDDPTLGPYAFWCKLMVAVRLCGCVLFVISISKLMASDMFHIAVREELASSSGAGLRCFAVTTICLTALWVVICLAIGLPGQNVLRLGVAAPIFFVMFTIVKFWALAVLLLLWQLSISRINRLRDRVVSHDAYLHKMWRSVTREYKDVVGLIDAMWSRTGFSNAWALMFASDLVAIGGLVGTMKRYQTDTWMYVLVSSFWVLSLGLSLAIVLFCFTSINAQSVSVQHSKQSVLYVGRKHLGAVPPQHVEDHLCFLRCVEGMPCGVEVFGVGLVSNNHVMPVMRVAVAAVPLLVAVAIHVTHIARH